MSDVKRALIPCGGKGTRMALLSGGRAKELMPIGGVPLLLRVMAECASSGIEEVLVVAAPHKEDVVEIARGAAGKDDMPARVETVIQREPRGLADAIRLGREFAAGDAIGVALPDNLFVAQVPAMAQLIETHQQTGKNVVAMVELFPEDAARAGPTSLYPGILKGDEYAISEIPSKGSRSSTFDLKGMPSGFTGVGRYVFLPEVFGAIDEIERQLKPGEELDDIPVMSLLLQRGRLTGRRIVGDFLDVGLPAGYRDANERFAPEDQQPRLAR
ncbi:MAG: sugar phosphate nucleotidyltransferase [Gemmatimonadaceae bacterium]|jgi:UTP--glucose-1-phosphate uridylyltransferase